MTFELKDGVRYRMPVMFGPTPGPRQHPEGRPWTVEETGIMNAQWITINYLTRAEQLEALLHRFIPAHQLQRLAAQPHDAQLQRSHGSLYIVHHATGRRG